MSVTLESPVVGHEQPDDLILNARRKLFPITVTNSLFPSPEESERELESLSYGLSLTSVVDTDFSTAENSPTTEQSPRKRVVSFAKMQTEPGGERGTGGEGGGGGECVASKHAQLPSLALLSPRNEDKGSPPGPLIRARLVSKTSTRHILVLSFPRIACDFWSSCLFMQQLTDLYSKLEKSAGYRPSLAAKKLEGKRQGVLVAYEREKRKNGHGRRIDAATRLILKRQQPNRPPIDDYSPMVCSKLKFPQVAQREKQLLMMLSRDRLFDFWEGVVMATIRRDRGTSRTKVVPPVRIPSGLGEMAPVMMGYGRRPQTSRLRPLTASRTRPVTARRQGGGAFGEVGFPREALLGPKTNFHFIKVGWSVCSTLSKLIRPLYIACDVRKLS